MKSCQYKSSDELPLILNVQEVSNFLGLGLSQVYELVKRIDFPAFKVGSRIFVPKDKFLTWLNVQTEEKDSLFYTECQGWTRVRCRESGAKKIFRM